MARLDSPGVESDYQKSYPDGIVFYAGENGPKIVNGHLFCGSVDGRLIRLAGECCHIRLSIERGQIRLARKADQDEKDGMSNRPRRVSPLEQINI